MKISEIIDNKPMLPISEDKDEPSNSSQLSLLKLSDDEIVEFIRPEANLEKWQSFIFPHPKAKGLDKERTLEFPISLPDGRQVHGKITVNPAQGRKSTTSRSYDVYLALVAIWDSHDLPDEPFSTSVREIVRIMGVPENGKWYKVVSEELETLYVTTNSWIMSYSGKTKQETAKLQNVLEVYEYVSLHERADQTDKFDKVCLIRLDWRIRQNHKRNNTNPILWSVRKSIRSSIARVYYSKVDTQLYNRIEYVRTGRNLVTDLMLSPNGYEYLSQRLILVEKLKEQLDGKTLSCLKTLHMSIENTVDGTDIKLIARRGNSKAPLPYNNLPILNQDDDYLSYMVDTIVSVVGGGDSNKKFYRRLAIHYSKNHILRAL